MILTILSLFLFSPPSHAKVVMLNCNISGGDIQEFSVVQKESSLFLDELDITGSMHERPLSLAEWNSKKIKLFTLNDSAKAYAFFDQKDGWFFRYQDGTFAIGGAADCK